MSVLLDFHNSDDWADPGKHTGKPPGLTACGTRWGQGSHWENATFFDAGNENEALPIFDFFRVDC